MLLDLCERSGSSWTCVSVMDRPGPSVSFPDPPGSHLPTKELLVLQKYEYFNNLVMINLTHSSTLLKLS